MHAAGSDDQDTSANDPSSKKDEQISFILLAVFLAPILSIIIVGGYGFLVWIYQIFAGPPTA